MIPKPNLDDRTFQDIVDEALRLIPQYCPDWTNLNPSDPGVTLVELFAHYPNDSLLYLFAHRLLQRAGRPDAVAYLRERIKGIAARVTF